MKLHKIKFILSILILLFMPVISLFTGIPLVYAASSPDLGLAKTFGILSSTFTNTASGTTINGDLGYTTGPAVAPTVNGTTYSPPSGTYSTAGTDQGSALANLNSQACTHTFPAGAVNLATDTSHGTIGVYTPGVYCTTATSAASIGAAGITLNGSGTYIFRIDGALTTVANSTVTLSNGASSCDVWWTPTAATTLGANTTFAGTVIDAAGITIGSTVTWIGRALAFGGTVTTASDTITVPTCSAATSSSSASSSSSSSSNTAAACVTALTKATPTIIATKRISPTSISLNWGPYQGINTFIVEYGFENGKWLYNTKVTGFDTTINGLPTNMPIWIRVAATDNCGGVQTYSSALLGGSPLLPNTGNGRTEKSNTIFSNFFHIISAWFYQV